MAFKEFVADVSNVVSGGDGHTVVCMSETDTNFTFDNVIGLMLTMGDYEETKDIQKTELYHTTETVDKPGLKKISDIEFVQLLTVEQYNKVSGMFDTDKTVYFGVFDADREFARINSFKGKISKVKQSLPNHDYGKISFTLSVEKGRLEATYTDEVVEQG